MSPVATFIQALPVLAIAVMFIVTSLLCLTPRPAPIKVRRRDRP